MADTAIGAGTDTAKTQDAAQTAGTDTAKTQDNTVGAAGTTDTTPKTYTQAELDAAITARLARERNSQQNAEELKAFREWKKSQQTEAEKQAAIVKERDEAQAELATERLKTALYAAGYTAADNMKYLLFCAGEVEGDVAAKVAAVLKENPPKTGTAQRQNSRPDPKGNAPGTNTNDMNAFILSAAGRTRTGG